MSHSFHSHADLSFCFLAENLPPLHCGRAAVHKLFIPLHLLHTVLWVVHLSSLSQRQEEPSQCNIHEHLNLYLQNNKKESARFVSSRKMKY